MFSLCGLHFLSEIYCLFSDYKSNTYNNKCENTKKRIEITGSFTVETHPMQSLRQHTLPAMSQNSHFDFPATELELISSIAVRCGHITKFLAKEHEWKLHVPLLGPAHRKLPHLHSMCPSFPAAAIQMVSKPTLETLPASVLWELIEEGPLPSCMSPSKAK